MNTATNTLITVEALLYAPVEKVWKYWTETSHICRWNHASDDWHTTKAQNDLRPTGRFLSHMEAKDGSAGFDFEGVYTEIDLHRHIAYTLDDGRKVIVRFAGNQSTTTVTEVFEADGAHPTDMQQAGWQAILDNFKKYVEEDSLHFDITINAAVEKVYDCMLDEKHYSTWTAAFNPGSFYKGSWETGAKILFLGVDQNGATGGMVSRIKENIPNRFVSIEHLGFVQGGEEITSGKEVEEWAGAQENYSFQEVEGKTHVSVYMDSSEDFKAYFAETWPKALARLKAICEA